MAYCQAKIGWKRPRKREKKIIVPFHSVPTRPVREHSKKIAKKFKKFKNTIRHQFRPKYVGKYREREKIKIIIPLRSYPTGYRKFQKKAKKF